MGKTAILLTAMLFLVTACAPPQDPVVEIRRQNIELREKVSALETSQVKLKEQVVGLQDQVKNLQKLPPDIIKLLDLPVAIKLDTGTGLLDRDNQSGYESARLVVAPTDALGYAVRVPGSFTATVFDLLAQPEPRKLGTIEIPANKVRDLWYETMFGRYYSFEVPLTIQPSGKEVTVRVVFVNAINGQTLETQMVLPIPSPLTNSTSQPASQPSASAP